MTDSRRTPDQRQHLQVPPCRLYRCPLIDVGRYYAITMFVPITIAQRRLVSLRTSDCNVTAIEDARSSVATLESYKGTCSPWASIKRENRNKYYTLKAKPLSRAYLNPSFLNSLLCLNFDRPPLVSRRDDSFILFVASFSATAFKA
jgi:hypothetical protein